MKTKNVKDLTGVAMLFTGAVVSGLGFYSTVELAKLKEVYLSGLKAKPHVVAIEEIKKAKITENFIRQNG